MFQILPVCGDVVSISKTSQGAYAYTLNTPSDGSCPPDLSPDSECFATVADMLAFGVASYNCPDGDFVAELVNAVLDLAAKKCEMSVYGLPAYLQMRLVSMRQRQDTDDALPC